MPERSNFEEKTVSGSTVGNTLIRHFILSDDSKLRNTDEQIFIKKERIGSVFECADKKLIVSCDIIPKLFVFEDWNAET